MSLSLASRTVKQMMAIRLDPHHWDADEDPGKINDIQFWTSSIICAWSVWQISGFKRESMNSAGGWVMA